ncbi:hypothetical protein LTR37_020969 [Vermiconidia calcicola]|uniref:Uncharacterized protein n=1 Tax=Vermiconidia calcicola TaxID=1690605 RepID=A0ACC3M9U6_9PEZI|nr:hypothetical protein LTR37_020969 [Vermiconidia calcicola]
MEVYNKEAVSPGYWFVAPYEEVAQKDASPAWNAPHIYDNNGDLIWSGAPMFNGFSTFDFRVVDVLGKPMLSLIIPHDDNAVILDETYNVYKKISPGPDRLEIGVTSLDIHEFMTSDNGTKALYLTRNRRDASRENSKVIGYDGNCFAVYSGFSEMDMETGEVVMAWDAENHIGLDESVVTQDPVKKRCSRPGEPWDFMHGNSIDKFPNGDYLISGRRSSAIYKVSGTDGSIIWRLGGKKSDFELPVEFSGQHSAKVVSYNNTHTLISLLDNAYGPGDPQITNEASRGLLLALDTTSMVVELVTEYKHPDGPDHYATGQGNMQMLPNGHAWICFTELALHTEYDVNGTLIMRAEFEAKVRNYRSWKLPWVGQPSQPPDVYSGAVINEGTTHTVVYMSWNGATEVSEWHVYATNARGKKRLLIATTPRRGFETSVWAREFANHVIVEAIDADGNKLGESQVFATVLPPLDPAAPWLEWAVGNSLITFFGGILVCVFAASVAYGVWFSIQRAPFSRWRKSKEVYEPVSKADRENVDYEDVELSSEDAWESPQVGLLGEKDPV